MTGVDHGILNLIRSCRFLFFVVVIMLADFTLLFARMAKWPFLQCTLARIMLMWSKENVTRHVRFRRFEPAHKILCSCQCVKSGMVIDRDQLDFVSRRDIDWLGQDEG